MEQNRFSSVAARPSVRLWPIVFGGMLCAATLGVSGGCGNSLASVAGKVTLDGEPIRGGEDVRATVYFNPAGSGGVAAVGLVDENGEYRLATGSEAGVPPGEYKVTFTAAQLVRNAAGGAPGGKRISPPRYAVADTSGLSFTVEPGSNTYDLVLSSAP
jgi:hypothetical protein